MTLDCSWILYSTFNVVQLKDDVDEREEEKDVIQQKPCHRSGRW